MRSLRAKIQQNESLYKKPKYLSFYENKKQQRFSHSQVCYLFKSLGCYENWEYAILHYNWQLGLAVCLVIGLVLQG